MTDIHWGQVMFSNCICPILRSRCFRTFMVVCAFLFYGCAQEEVPYSEPPNLKLGGPGRQCLSETGEVIEQFLQGLVSDTELEEFWDCLGGALGTFADYTKGQHSDRYKSTEIRTFLAKFFLGDVKISDGMLNQIMQVKRLFVGGGDKSFTRDEIAKTQQFIGDVKRLTVLINPHMNVLYAALTRNGDKQKSINDVDFEVAMKTFDKVTQEISLLILKNNQSYLFSDLSEFLKEVFLLIDYDDDEGPEGWLKYIPLLTKGKQILVGGDEHIIVGNEWKQVLSIFSHFLQSVARLSFYVVDSKFGSYQNIVQIQAIYRDFDKVFSDALDIHPGNTITYDLLFEFIDVVENLFEIPFDFSAQQIKEILQMLVEKILTPAEQNGKLVEGITYVHLDEARKEFFYWIRSQLYAWDIVQAGGQLPREPQLPAEKELYRIAFGGPWKLVRSDRGAMQIDWRETIQYDLNSLNHLNWQRTVARILIRRFAEDSERREKLSYLTKDEFVKVQQAIEPLGVALGLFEPGDTSMALRILREASLFMPRSDGDESLTYEEGVEYLAYVMSALTMQGIIFEELTDVCPMIEEDGETKVDATCFRSESAARMSSFLHHLPNMRVFFEVPDSAELWGKFEKYQEEIVRSDGYAETPIKKGEVLEMWMLLQYIETFFGRFDSRNPKTTINLEDSLDAYVVYEPYLRELLKQFPFGKKDRRALFTYLFKYGKVHILDDVIGGAVRFVWWRLNEKSWEYEASRMRVIQILASLSAFQNQVIGNKLVSFGASQRPDGPISCTE